MLDVNWSNISDTWLQTFPVIKKSLLFSNAICSNHLPMISSHWLRIHFTKCMIFITARKRSLRRLCFYTCLSFCPQGESVFPIACWDAPNPPSPRPETDPLRDQRQAPRPGAVHAGRYGQQAGGTHPTGIHSCYITVYTKCFTNSSKINENLFLV